LEDFQMSWEWYLFITGVLIFLGGMLFLTYEVIKTPDEREKMT